jgi:hypothetical protein
MYSRLLTPQWYRYHLQKLLGQRQKLAIHFSSNGMNELTDNCLFVVGIN